MLDAIVPDDGVTRGKFGACKEIPDLLKWSTVLQGKTHQAGDDVVEADQFRGTVRTFHAKKDFCWLCVVMHAAVERALSGNPDLQSDAMKAGEASETYVN